MRQCGPNIFKIGDIVRSKHLCYYEDRGVITHINGVKCKIQFDGESDIEWFHHTNLILEYVYCYGEDFYDKINDRMK